eukprot:2058585-Amphidinium_carterae.1
MFILSKSQAPVFATFVGQLNTQLRHVLVHARGLPREVRLVVQVAGRAVVGPARVVLAAGPLQEAVEKGIKLNVPGVKGPARVPTVHVVVEARPLTVLA